MGEALALLAMILWASGTLLTRVAFEGVDRDQGFLISQAANAAVLLVVGSLWLISVEGRPMSLAAVGLFVAAGMSGTLLGRWASFGAIQHLGPSRATLYKNMQPLFTTVLAVALLGELLAPLNVIGAVAILMGISLTSAEPLLDQGKARWGISHESRRVGIALGVLAALGYSGGNILKKVAMALWPEPVLGAALGAITAVILSAVFAKSGVVARSVVDRRRAGYGLFLAVGALTAGAQVAFLASLVFTDVWIVSVILAAEPVLLVLVSRTLLPGREVFTPWSTWGGVLVVAGLVAMFVA